MSAMRAVSARLRADFRVRWRSWVGLALVIGVGGGVVLTAAAGARRTDTAYPRFLQQSGAEDVLLAGGFADPAATAFLHDLEQVPQVAAAGPVGAMILLPPDGSLQTPYHFAGMDTRYGDTVDRPNLLSGRRPDPDGADEVLVNRTMARERHLRVGSTIDWTAYAPQDEGPDSALVGGEPVHLRVVGIGVYPNEVVSTAPYDDLPVMYLTAAYYRAHPTQTQGYSFEAIRLRRGNADMAAFRASMARVLADHGVSEENFLFADRSGRNAGVQRAIRPQALALGLFALLAGLVGLLVIGQATARRIALDAADYPVLSAIGMSRGQLVATSMARIAAVSVAGAAMAVAVAAAASPLTPIGPARLAEPHPGLALNAAILGIAFLAIPALIVAAAFLPAWWAASVERHLTRTTDGPAAAQGFRTADTLAAAGLPKTAVIGVGTALHRSGGRTGVPVRSALVISGIAIAAVVGTLTFTANLDHLVQTPKAYGWNWDFRAGIGFFPVPLDQAMPRLRANPDVEAVAGANYGEVRIGGRSVAAVGIDAIDGSLFPTLLEGRAPRDDHEIVLGTRTLRRAKLAVGDTVGVQVSNSPQPMRVVGRAIFPKLGAGNFDPTDLGEGAAVTAGVFADPSAPPEQAYTVLLVKLRPGADVAANQRRLDRDIGSLSFCGGIPGCVSPAERPGDISNYARVRGTPLALAGVLTLLAVGVLGHALITSVRRRRRDLAVLETLGFVRAQLSAVTAWQATTTAAAALLVGLPVGIAAGNWAWRVFAGQLGVAPGSVTPVTATILAAPVTILLANLIAAVPARLALGTKPAVALRSE
ncbi:MAG: putative transport system permease protein [Actinomycetota bacterium]|nr:putative transport system permease protein [Actinomycetota bacterium]